MKTARRGVGVLWLAVSAALAAVPTPQSLVRPPDRAVDRTVLDWDKVVGYFQALAKSSDRIQVEELGKSTEGRPFIAATIADPETLRHLDRYIEIQRKLADPRQTPESEAERLFLEGKAVVLITCSIHCHRDRFHPHRRGVRLPPAHRGQPAPSRHSARHDPAAGAVAESGRRGHRHAVVPQDAGHAV